MKSTIWIVLLFLSSILPLVAQTETSPSAFLDPQSAPKSGSQEEQLYASANDALNSGNYDQAIRGFDQVARSKGRRADGALYWKAYALNKVQRRSEALEAVAQLRKEYPQSSYLNQAKVLEMDIHPENPDSISDDDLKPYAVDSLMYTDPEKALPILQKLLQGNASAKVKDRALFVLMQSSSPQAHQLLVAIAKGNTQPELQGKAIRWLAMSGQDKQLLRELYSSAPNAQIKRDVLRSFIVNGDKEGLLAIVREEKSPELRREGIRQLGPMGATAELRQLYKESGDVETKDAILQAMGIAGDTQDLAEMAKNETDPEIRARAIRNVGLFGGDAAMSTLMSIYNSNASVEAKKEVIRALFLHGAAKEMVAMARKETNAELKQEIVRMLALMHSPEATEYMMEILSK